MLPKTIEGRYRLYEQIARAQAAGIALGDCRLKSFIPQEQAFWATPPSRRFLVLVGEHGMAVLGESNDPAFLADVAKTYLDSLGVA